MKVSLNWVKEFTSIDLPVDKLVEKIGAQLGAVEEVIELGKKYQGIVVVKVVECQKHAGADKLSVCLVDDGEANKNVKRNNDGLIEVVCGAPNVKAGILVPWIPPGATVPSSPEAEPFVIEEREIRGAISHGMLASAKELAIGDSHDGILILEEGQPGEPLAKALKLDDHIIDIENKMFTHRPDCFGMLGVAREIAGITGKPFKSPDWYQPQAALSNDGRKNVLKLEVKNDLPELVPRFCAVAIKDIKVGPSPAWLQSYLARVGVRPINNIVDITNYVMLETAQPLHAYDYDKLKTGTLGVRKSQKGEQVTIIGGKTIKLDHEAIVITDGDKPIGMGGVMGGADTEVDNNTKNIILEVATFDMNTTRRTAMAYGLFTDAATRFTKGQSPLQNMAVLVKATKDIQKIAGGRVASEAIDNKKLKNKLVSLKIEPEFINQRLGLDLSAKDMSLLLENVEFKADISAGNLKITPPFWRTDIEIPEDVVEEVGRLYGYDKLPLTLPKRDLAPAARNAMLDFKTRLREILRNAGANEVLTYSFVHGELMKKAGQDPEQAYQIGNALSPDLQYYRLSLTPSLLEKVHPNIKAGFGEFALFEIGKGHLKNYLDKDGLPTEIERISVVVTSKKPRAGAPFFAAKKICEYLLQELGIQNIQYKPVEAKQASKTATYYDHCRTAELILDGQKIGRVGEYSPNVKNALKLPQYTAGFVLHINELLKFGLGSQYKPINRYPELEQDFCLRHASNQSYQQLSEFINDNLAELTKPHGYEFTLSPLDIYQPPNQDDYTQTTWRIILWHPERTLTTDETNKLLDELAARAKDQLKAERI